MMVITYYVYNLLFLNLLIIQVIIMLSSIHIFKVYNFFVFIKNEALFYIFYNYSLKFTQYTLCSHNILGILQLLRYPSMQILLRIPSWVLYICFFLYHKTVFWKGNVDDLSVNLCHKSIVGISIIGHKSLISHRYLINMCCLSIYTFYSS